MCGECPWPGNDPLYRHYHDTQWGRPVYDSQELFAKLCLDGQQAGLSWITILKRESHYYRVFKGFNPVKLATWGEEEVERCLQDTGIIRNRLKVWSIIKNAKGFLLIEQQQGDFARFLWQFVDNKQVDGQLTSFTDAPTQSEASRAMSKALKKYGFTFVGETICYAFMQAVGMVNDHLMSCSCYQACRAQGEPCFT